MSPQTTLLVTLPQEDEYKCPHCGAKIPKHLAGCWNCGKTIDTYLMKLAAKEAGK